MLSVKRSVGIGPLVRTHTSDKPTLALKLRPDVTRSPKQEYQWSHKTD